MKINFTKILMLVLCYLLIFSVVAFGEQPVQNNIQLFDYSVPFEVWQGNGDVSATVSFESDEKIADAIAFDNFEFLADSKGDKVDSSNYTTLEVNGNVKIILKEEYLKTFEQGAYRFTAKYKDISIALDLYVVTNKIIVKDYINSVEIWDGNDSLSLYLNTDVAPIAMPLFEGISYKGNKLNDSDYSLAFYGNSAVMTISSDYLKTLEAGEHYFNVEFLSVSGILVKVTIPDFYCNGDVNGDGNVTAADARLALRSAAKLEELTADAKNAADVDNDGKVTASDARVILRAVAKLEEL